MTSCPMGAARKEKQPLFFSPLAVEAQTLLASFQALAELQRVPAAACARIPPPSPTACQADKSFHREQQRACRQTAGKQLLIWPPQR